MDQALWITWYDLPDGGRDAYLDWLHGTHMPALVERPGVLWATHFASVERPVLTAKARQRRHPAEGSVPAGHRYLLIGGGEHARVFSHPTPGQMHAALSGVDRDMTALRIAPSVNVMIEHARIDGPEAARRDAGAPDVTHVPIVPIVPLGPVIQLGSFVYDGDEDELLAWYVQWRLPSMQTLPGCIGVRKLVSIAGWAKHAVLHEFVSVEARNEHFVNHEQKRHPRQAAWSERITSQIIHAPGAPNVARRLAFAVRR